MTFEELLTEADVELLRMRFRQAAAWEDGSIVTRDERRGSRRVIAATMVRIGAWLDNEAAERFVIARRTR